MNARAFREAVERRLLVEREAKVMGTLSSELRGLGPERKSPTFLKREAFALLRESILETARANPSWFPTAIAARCETSHTTVIRVLRRAGLYTAPTFDGSKWTR